MLVEKVLPLPNDESKHKRVYDLREELVNRYRFAPDLKDFMGTGWGFVSAVSDLVSHTRPKRMTASFQENRFAQVTAGTPELDRAVRLLVG